MISGFLRKLMMSTGHAELQPEDARLAIASVLVMAARADARIRALRSNRPASAVRAMAASVAKASRRAIRNAPARLKRLKSHPWHGIDKIRQSLPG